MAEKQPAGSKKNVAAMMVFVGCAAAAVMLMAARNPASPAAPAQPRRAETTIAASVSAPKPSMKRAAVKPAAPAPLAEPVVVQAADAVPAVKAGNPAVTVSGCLERSGNAFRLTDATGAQAPKGRSWKSGFLKKGTPNIDVIDSGNRLKLKDHVGHRVSVTGVLDDHEMQARSMQNLAKSCE